MIPPAGSAIGPPSELERTDRCVDRPADRRTAGPLANAPDRSVRQACDKCARNGKPLSVAHYSHTTRLCETDRGQSACMVVVHSQEGRGHTKSEFSQKKWTVLRALARLRRRFPERYDRSVPTKKCPYCSEQVQSDARKCKHCGEFLDEDLRATIAPRTPQPQSNFGVAALLSLFFPGAGQIYRGKAMEGIFWLIFVVIGYAIFIVPGIVLHIACVADAGSPPKSSGQSTSNRPSVLNQPLKPELLGWLVSLLLAFVAVAVFVASWLASLGLLGAATAFLPPLSKPIRQRGWNESWIRTLIGVVSILALIAAANGA